MLLAEHPGGGPPQLPHSAAEAIPVEASIMTSMSAIATRTVNFFLNTSCAFLPLGSGVIGPA